MFAFFENMELNIWTKWEAVTQLKWWLSKIRSNFIRLICEWRGLSTTGAVLGPGLAAGYRGRQGESLQLGRQGATPTA